MSENNQVTVLINELGITNYDFKTITNSILRGASNEDILFFLKTAQSLKLNPLAKQITAFKTWNKDVNGFIIQAFPTIDGLRVIAERSGTYKGQTLISYCGDDGQWSDFWNLKNGYPTAAKVGVYKEGFTDPVYGIVYWDAYKREDKKGELMQRWKLDPLGMLGKCAEAQALRRAFPNDVGGLYADIEIDPEQGLRDVNKEDEGNDEGEKYRILNDILELCKKHDYSTDSLKVLIAENYNKSSSKELTLDETRDLANDLVDILSNKIIDVDQ